MRSQRDSKASSVLRACCSVTRFPSSMPTRGYRGRWPAGAPPASRISTRLLGTYRLVEPSIRSAKGSGSPAALFLPRSVLKVVESAFQRIRTAVSAYARGVRGSASITLARRRRLGLPAVHLGRQSTWSPVARASSAGIAVGRVWHEVEGALDLPVSSRSGPGYSSGSRTSWPGVAQKRQRRPSLCGRTSSRTRLFAEAGTVRRRFQPSISPSRSIHLT